MLFGVDPALQADEVHSYICWAAADGTFFMAPDGSSQRAALKYSQEESSNVLPGLP